MLINIFKSIFLLLFFIINKILQILTTWRPRMLRFVIYAPPEGGRRRPFLPVARIYTRPAARINTKVRITGKKFSVIYCRAPTCLRRLFKGGFLNFKRGERPKAHAFAALRNHYVSGGGMPHFYKMSAIQSSDLPERASPMPPSAIMRNAATMNTTHEGCQLPNTRPQTRYTPGDRMITMEASP